MTGDAKERLGRHITTLNTVMTELLRTPAHGDYNYLKAALSVNHAMELLKEIEEKEGHHE